MPITVRKMLVATVLPFAVSDNGFARKRRIPRQGRELSVAGMNDVLQAIGELSSRKRVCDCRFMGQKKVACPCVGLSPMLNKSKERLFVCEALLAPELICLAF